MVAMSSIFRLRAAVLGRFDRWDGVGRLALEVEYCRFTRAARTFRLALGALVVNFRFPFTALLFAFSIATFARPRRSLLNFGRFCSRLVTLVISTDSTPSRKTHFTNPQKMKVVKKR